jgi:hypothetical protein
LAKKQTKKVPKKKQLGSIQRLRIGTNRLNELPFLLRILAIFLSYNFSRGFTGKSQAQKDYDDAIRYLREREGFTGKR